MGCCDGCTFFKIYLKQFFDFGYNCGSLISELIGAIRTFQRITATVSFKTRFSPDCVKMFNWALVAVDAITGMSYTSPFSEFEFYQIYTLVIPVTIMTFLLRLVLPIRYFIYALLPTSFLLMTGAGIGFIKVNNAIGISLTVLGIIFFIVSILIIVCCDSAEKFIDKAEDQSITVGKFCFSLRVAIFFGFALMIPIMLERESFTNFFTIIMIAIAGILIIFSICVRYCNETFYDKEVGIKVIEFIYSIIQLLIVPSTEHFMELQESAYKRDWRCIVSYIFLSLIFPLTITFVDIAFGGESSNGRYKAESWVKYVGLIDILKQILYAIFAGLDLAWGCLFVELAWGVFLLIVRPFARFCEYFLEVGNSLVMIAANSVILYSIYHNSEIYSIDVAIPLIVIAFLPAIVAMYIYFIFDFGKVKEYDSESTVDIMKLESLLMGPISWLFYGINLSLIDKKVYKLL